MSDFKSSTQSFYENSYKELGSLAQRKYPNEELCRFMGRNFFSINFKERENIKILETGCGSGANLWMIAKEGFKAYGIDFSLEAINLARKTLETYAAKAELSVQDMSSLSFSEKYFDAVVDVFSSNCLPFEAGKNYLKGVRKILKPGGIFFSYFPCKESDAFLNPGTSHFVDCSTLDGITRKNSPFFGQTYPFRFIHYREYEELLTRLGFIIQYSECVTKTYNGHQENFSWCVIEAKVPNE